MSGGEEFEQQSHSCRSQSHRDEMATSAAQLEGANARGWIVSGTNSENLIHAERWKKTEAW
jgi:hypothetical protein